MNASTDMVGVTIFGYCPTCTAKLSVPMTPGGITPQTTYNLLELSYGEHCRTYHEDSWRKLATDAMRQLQSSAPYVSSLGLRLEKLEAKQ